MSTFFVSWLYPISLSSGSAKAPFVLIKFDRVFSRQNLKQDWEKELLEFKFINVSGSVSELFVKDLLITDENIFLSSLSKAKEFHSFMCQKKSQYKVSNISAITSSQSIFFYNSKSSSSSTISLPLLPASLLSLLPIPI